MIERLKAWLAGDAAETLTGLRFEFNAPVGIAFALLALLALGLGASLYYWPRLAKLRTPLRVLLVVLRAVVMVLALFLLLDPCIVGKQVDPASQYVALLFDDSQSMRIVGEDGLSRADRMTSAYEASRESLEEALRKRFQITKYRFGGSVERIRSLEDLAFEDRETDLIGAIGESLHSLQGVNVSGIVVFSDGIQQSEEASVALDDIVALDVPVFTVGTDTESQWRDVQIGDLSVTRSEFDQSPVVITFPVRVVGLAESEVVAEVILGDRVVLNQTFGVESDDHEQEVRLEFVPQDKGWQEYRVRVRLAETGSSRSNFVVPEIAVPGKDGVIQNNERRVVIDNREKEYRILYFSGGPTWENKYFSRALAEDEQLHLTRLLRISPEDKKFVFRGAESGGMSNPLFEGTIGDREHQPRYDESVFLRLGGEEMEFDAGFPILPEELFDYDLLILSDIEHDFFALEQLELTREYVRKRGGSLLYMGGLVSFTEGGYAGTILENMLPVVLREDDGSIVDMNPPPEHTRDFRAAPTIDGLLSGSWSLDPDMDESSLIWEEMGDLRGLNLFVTTRAGTTVLARAEADWFERGQEAPLFAYQRFGEGKCAILATSTLWQWKMKPEDDDYYERLWRQIIRNLVTNVPEAVYMRSKKDAYALGDPVKFDFVVRDEKFDQRAGQRVTVTVRAPSGSEAVLAVDESLDENGLYTAEFIPEEAGLHWVSLESLDEKDEVTGALDDEAFLVEPDEREFQRPRYNGEALKEISARTGGAHFTLDRISEIADAIPWGEQEKSKELQIHLIWHWAPFFFMLLITALSIEWFVRRKKGYA